MWCTYSNTFFSVSYLPAWKIWGSCWLGKLGCSKLPQFSLYAGLYRLGHDDVFSAGTMNSWMMWKWQESKLHLIHPCQVVALPYMLLDGVAFTVGYYSNMILWPEWFLIVMIWNLWKTVLFRCIRPIACQGIRVDIAPDSVEFLATTVTQVVVLHPWSWNVSSFQNGCKETPVHICWQSKWKQWHSVFLSIMMNPEWLANWSNDKNILQ